MQVSTEVFSRMCLTAREISGIAGRDVECMGYLLAEKGDGTITGFYFPEQHGDEAESGTGDFPYRQLYEEGMNITGMWHSHGSFPVFHSPTDHNHVKNKLRAIKRENALLDSWDAYSKPGRIELFNTQTLQGLKIRLNIDYKPEIRSVNEILPETFHSIVINRETYSGKNVYDAMRFWLVHNELRKEKARITIAPVMAGKSLEEIANNYTLNSFLLKEHPAYKIQSLKARIIEDGVELKGKHGSFSIKCSNPEELAAAIDSIEPLSDEESDKYKQKLPQKNNAKQSISNLVDEKPIVPLKQYEFNNPLIEAMEAHTFYVRLFLSSMDFYRRSESCKRYLHADKAVIDIFAALSGIETGKTIEQHLKRIENAGVPLDVYINALTEAKKIIEKKNPPEKKCLLKKISKMLKKAGGEHA